ncbi:MAG TPA: hypothetical protein VIS52_09370 [Motiliproteus sp.]
MDDTKPNSGCRYVFQLERLYWLATASDSNDSQWQQAFKHLERQIQSTLSKAERSRLLRQSRSYQRLRQIAV